MGRVRIGIHLLLLLPFCAGAARAADPDPDFGSDLAGPATVTDGDTLVIAGTHIRLFGIDAPERSQHCRTATGDDWPCGGRARDRISALVAGQQVRCTPVNQDRYGRTVAQCQVGGVDIGGQMVAEGLAWAYTRYSAAYLGEEAGARAARRGIWQGEAEAAWDYRADGGFVPASGAAGAADPACQIKGNINSRGTRIYHQPQDRDYAKVHVTPSRGERWFCTPAEAEAAGWRPVAAP